MDESNDVIDSFNETLEQMNDVLDETEAKLKKFRAAAQAVCDAEAKPEGTYSVANRERREAIRYAINELRKTLGASEAVPPKYSHGPSGVMLTNPDDMPTDAPAREAPLKEWKASCPLGSGTECRITGKPCRIGLTDILRPDHCPLPLTFSARHVKNDPDDEDKQPFDVVQVFLASPPVTPEMVERAVKELELMVNEMFDLPLIVGVPTADSKDAFKRVAERLLVAALAAEGENDGS